MILSICLVFYLFYLLMITFDSEHNSSRNKLIRLKPKVPDPLKV